MESSSVAEAVEAIRRGEPVILPTDTVYGLCADAYRSEPAERVYRLKGRPQTQPTALVAGDVDTLLECIPELRGRSESIARALLPGPLTLILPNPARRFRWVAGESYDAIGVRVPALDGPAAEVLEQVGCVIATSANLAGGPDPRRLEAVPEEIRGGVAATIDGGELPGTPSTVLDFTGDEPKVVREGAVPATEALERAAAALA
ncbi:MAG: L-threonylcarbamoyladenylate synthase [Gaiellaceae bacterium]|jgi:L-threonylcarbamoyladenylate synthase|nr:L-threonylcarbamoyladenylate synthase [Gaiellaceae bacterium]MDX6518565.1 L-threonylcarbamoyladenylate synthase [Gaiellaceae bacterium]